MKLAPSSSTSACAQSRGPAFLMTAVTAAVMLCGTPAHAQGGPATAQAYVPGRILVMPRAGMTDGALAKILRENGEGRARRVGRSELRIVELTPGREQAMVERLARHPHFKFAELDRLVPASLVTNDPYFGNQWHLPKIGADAAWDQSSGSGITIAILDTGVDAAHPDLAAKIVPGWNFHANTNNTTDDYGHGTKVAGSAAAVYNNGAGVAGVAGAAKIMPIRIAGADGYASLSAMASGLIYAADNGARVANISYICADSATVISAANYMKSKGGLVTSSAGNYGVDEGIAATTSMIPVSATDSGDAKASWSSYGAYVAMSAPGTGIYSTTKGGGYGSVSGTSFSAPVTAGVIALMMAANPKLSSSEIESLLYATAVDLGTAGRDPKFGHGRVNAAAAVQAALNATSTADTQAPTASIGAPLGSSTVTGLVPVDVSASDNVGVTKVELRVNGTLVATDTSAPFAFSWDSAMVANGMATLSATAIDAAGNAGRSADVAVNVANVAAVDTVPPVLSIANPINGSKVKGNVAIKVNASDNNGTAGLVQTLYIDGARVATVSGGTLSYNWNTKKASAGGHSIQAVATDAAGNSTTQSVSVTK